MVQLNFLRVLCARSQYNPFPPPKFPVAPAGGGGYIKRNNKYIRFHPKGCANRPFHQIVITNRHRHLRSQPFEQLGSYDPMPNEDNQKMLSLNLERIRYWIGRGALCSKSVLDVLGRAGFLPIHPMFYEKGWEKRRKAREDRLKAQQEEKSAQETA